MNSYETVNQKFFNKVMMIRIFHQTTGSIASEINTLFKLNVHLSFLHLFEFETRNLPSLNPKMPPISRPQGDFWGVVKSDTILKLTGRNCESKIQNIRGTIFPILPY